MLNFLKIVPSIHNSAEQLVTGVCECHRVRKCVCTIKRNAGESCVPHKHTHTHTNKTIVVVVMMKTMVIVMMMAVVIGVVAAVVVVI